MSQASTIGRPGHQSTRESRTATVRSGQDEVGRPIGARVVPGGGVEFRVWAPNHAGVDVVLESGTGVAGEPAAQRLAREDDGYHAGVVPTAVPGTLYRYRLDGGASYPDPASRFQPEGPHGPSMVVDPSAYTWHDAGWKGLTLLGQVLYELHVGTFTPEGTWSAAAVELTRLKEVGITAVEVMPVAEFPGEFGWGYDGVDLYAPYHGYGTPDDMRRFVDEAHRLGLGVILDVVYNHLGPDGAYHKVYSEAYYNHTRDKTEWGDALNFDGPQCRPVRDFFAGNAAYWIDEFHLDGLRLDAVHAIHDSSEEHILASIARRTRAAAERAGRSILLIAEDDSQDTIRQRPIEQGGQGLDAQWNDDFHHAAVVALTGRSEAYYSDFSGSPQELISAIKWGFLFQGQYFSWQKRHRGTPTFGLPGAAFVTFLENHDQVSNSARGDRLRALTSPGRYKALTAAWLLAPGTPMFFQGQEYGSLRPFHYFADHVDELAALVQKGRYEFLGQFRSISADVAMQQALPDPGRHETFERSRLDPAEQSAYPEITALHKDLLKLRREDLVFHAQDATRIYGAVIGPEGFVLRYFGTGTDCRLVLVNLGRDLFPNPTSEPLLAPPVGQVWETLWYSEHPRYGGCGAPPYRTEDHWRIPGHCTIVLRPMPRSPGG
jgi:maltooligosyltrehalose trehalohydrolase